MCRVIKKKRNCRTDYGKKFKGKLLKITHPLLQNGCQRRRKKRKSMKNEGESTKDEFTPVYNYKI